MGALPQLAWEPQGLWQEQQGHFPLQAGAIPLPDLGLAVFSVALTHTAAPLWHFALLLSVSVFKEINCALAM